MMVRVVIERWLLPGRDMADPSHYVIVSSWRSRGDWDQWAGCEARQRARSRIAPLLARPERVAVLEPA
jgi:quinol monooxygenase YgiN